MPFGVFIKFAYRKFTGVCGWSPRYGASDSPRDFTVTPAVLKRGVPLILEATLEDEGLAICYDALQRVPGPSALGDFYYLPVLFHETERPSHIQRSLLALCGLLLGTLQGKAPGYGILIHGRGCEVRRIPLPPDNAQARRVLQELRELQLAPHRR